MNRIRDILNTHLFQAIFIGLLALLLLRTSGANAAALSENCGTWKFVPTPPLDNNLDELNGVAALSTNNVWAVGERQGYTETLTEHWDGAQWSVVPFPPQQPYEGLDAVASVSSTDIWSVGTAIANWNGTQWNNRPLASFPALTGIAIISATDIWVVGTNANTGGETIILHYSC